MMECLTNLRYETVSNTYNSTQGLLSSYLQFAKIFYQIFCIVYQIIFKSGNMTLVSSILFIIFQIN